MPDEIPPFLLAALNSLIGPERRHLVTLQAHLRIDLGLDHLAPLDLSEAIHDETGHEVDGDTIDRWEIVGDIIETLKELQDA